MSDIEVSTQGGSKGNANLIYILYLVSVVSGITALVGVIMAYIGMDEADDVTQSHYRNQIHIFWKGLLYGVISALLVMVVIGLPMLLATLVWYIVRTAKGMDKLSKGQAYPNPESWMF